MGVYRRRPITYLTPKEERRYMIFGLFVLFLMGPITFGGSWLCGLILLIYMLFN